MSLKEKTEQIIIYSKTIKNNFIKIGKILIEIRDKELFIEKFKSFTQYLESSDFDFGRSTAYKMMDVYNEYGENDELINRLGIGKLIELTFVPDKQLREEITEKAIKENLSEKEIREEVKKVKEDELFNQIKRKAQREDQELFNEIDDPLAKCKRQANNILKDIERLSIPIRDMEVRLEKWSKFANKFKEDKEVDSFKAAILLSWSKVRRSSRKVEDWFD